MRLALLFSILYSYSMTCLATLLNVYESPDLQNIFGNIQTIQTAESGKQHYNYYSVSGHPSGVQVGFKKSNVWVHESTLNGEFSFGFIFNKDNAPNGANDASFRFRITDSLTPVFVSQADDPHEATEDPLTPGAFSGTFWYNRNTDGIMVSGITGMDWTIIIDSVDFGNVHTYKAASGELPGYSDDLALQLGNEYRITPFQNTVSTLSVSGFGAPLLAKVKEPSNRLLFILGLCVCLFIAQRLRLTSENKR